MAAVAVSKPYSLKTATATFKADGETSESDFSDHISQIELTPTSTTGSWTSISGKTIQDAAAATWAVTVGLIQDLATSGFMRYLLANAGKKCTCKFTFATGTDPLTLAVTLQPSNIGGSADGNPVAATVSLPVDGTPVFGTVVP